VRILIDDRPEVKETAFFVERVGRTADRWDVDHRAADDLCDFDAAPLSRFKSATSQSSMFEHYKPN